MGPAFSAVNHKIRADRPKQNWVGSQVFATVSHTWILTQSFKSIEQLLNPAVGGVDIVSRDVLPDFI
jgi:hypothetical protein